jgi:Na+-transporting methylmalonyl-CoA/oxaloacetate decarboxylase gamma subunit
MLHFENIGKSLWLMLMGMVGIFVVMVIIMLVVILLNKFAKDAPKVDKKTGNNE